MLWRELILPEAKDAPWWLLVLLAFGLAFGFLGFCFGYIALLMWLL